MTIYERLANLPLEDRLLSLETLPTYLGEHKQADRLRKILTEFDFLQAKIEVLGVEALLTDCYLSADPDVGIIRSLLSSCAHILIEDRGQFLVQLSGRLSNLNYRAEFFSPNHFHGRDLFFSLPALASKDDALIRTFTGHTSAVTKIATGPNDTFWTVSWDRTAVQWRMGSNEQLTVLTHSRKVTAVAASPDLVHLITGDDEGNLYVWDIESRLVVNSVHAHTGEITDINFGSDPRKLITGSSSQIAKLWNFALGQLIEETPLRGHTSAINVVRLDNQRGRAITGSWDNSVIVHELNTRKSIQLNGHQSGVRDIFYNPGRNEVMSASSDRTVIIWNLSTYSYIARLQHTEYSKLTGVLLLPERNLIVASGEDGDLHFWDSVHHRYLGKLTTGSVYITTMCILSAQYILVAGEDAKVRAYDLMRIQPGTPSIHESYVESVSIVSTNRAVSISGGGSLHFWDLKKQEILMSIPDVGLPVMSSAQITNKSGQAAVILMGPHGAAIWNEGTRYISELTYTKSKWISDAEYLSKRGILLVCQDEVLLFVNPNTYDLVMQIPFNGGPFSKIAVSPDERYLAHLQIGGQIDLYELDTYKLLFSRITNGTLDIEFSRKSQLITIAKDEIQLWELFDAEPLKKYQLLRPATDYNENVGLTGQLAISEDRDIIVFTIDDTRLRILAADTLEPLAKFTHNYPIHTCAITSDPEREMGYRIIAGDAEGEVLMLQFLREVRITAFDAAEGSNNVS